MSLENRQTLRSPQPLVGLRNLVDRLPIVSQYKRPSVTTREEYPFLDQVRQAAPLLLERAQLKVSRPYDHRTEAVIPQGLGKTKLLTNHMKEVLMAKEVAEEDPVTRGLDGIKLTSKLKVEGSFSIVTGNRQPTSGSRPSSVARSGVRSAYASPITSHRNRSEYRKKAEVRSPLQLNAKPIQLPYVRSKTNTSSPISQPRTRGNPLIWNTSFETPRHSLVSPIKSKRADSLIILETSKEPCKDFYDGEYSKDQKEGFGKVVYSNGDVYAGNWRKNMRHGHGLYNYVNLGLKYDGDWENNSKNGTGVMTFSNGDIMESGWDINQVSETKVGRYAYISGDNYEGTLRKGMRHGTGLMYYSCGAKYEGGWKDDGRDGTGAMWLSEGCVFQGLFTSDSTNGFGYLIIRNAFPMPRNPNFGDYNADAEPDYTALSTYRGFIADKTPRTSGNSSSRSDASTLGRVKVNLDDSIWVTMTSEEVAAVVNTAVKLPKGVFIAGKLQGAAYWKLGVYGAYQGTFKDGKRSGYGKMSYKDPEHQVTWFPEMTGVYVGNWLNDERHGFGTMTWEKNIKYEGQWRQDRRHKVEGKMFFESGDIYEGSWQDNVMHGNAVFKLKDGKEYRGRFRMGVPEPFGVLVLQNGDRYEGDLLEMMAEGHGKTTLMNGNVHEGQYEAGIRQGYGTMRFTDGGLFSGDWKNGVREGTGIMTYSMTGETYEGLWSNDRRHGFGVLYSRTGETLFSGMWREDMKDGQGKVAYNGHEYTSD